jgi:hypothetical protein
MNRANVKPTCRAQRPGSSGCSRPDASIGAPVRGRGNNPISDTGAAHAARLMDLLMTCIMVKNIIFMA